MPEFGIKNFLSIFDVAFEKDIAIFEINSLNLSKSKALCKNKSP